MKKFIFAIVAVVLLLGFISACTSDTTDQQLYEHATDKDDVPSPGDKGGNN